MTCWQTDAAKNLALFPNRLAPSKPITDSSQFVYYSTSATTRYCACSTTLLYCLRQNRLQKPLLSSLRWWSKNSFNRNSHNTKTLLKRTPMLLRRNTGFPFLPSYSSIDRKKILSKMHSSCRIRAFQSRKTHLGRHKKIFGFICVLPTRTAKVRAF